MVPLKVRTGLQIPSAVMTSSENVKNVNQKNKKKKLMLKRSTVRLIYK